MDIAITSGADVVIRFADGSSRTFPRLRVKDLGALQAAIPGDNRFITLFELYRWAQTPDGADRALLLSLRRAAPDATEADVEALGSLLTRVEIARALLGASVTTGEEPPADENELKRDLEEQQGKARGPGTGPAKPS